MPISRRPTQALTLLLASALLLPAAFAQTNPAHPAAAAVSVTPPSDEDLIAIREQLLALLRTSPTLSQVLETDPTLLADQDYIARTNPQLAQFLIQHPELTRNPDFYLFANLPSPRGRHIDSLHRRSNGNQPPTEEQMRLDMRRGDRADLMALLAFVGVAGSFLWLIHILLQSRRWNRIFNQQSDIHTKLIDRFASNQELLHYMETDPGKRFLEAAPIPIALDREQRLPGGITRILGPLQIGVVLTLLGIGLLILERSLPDIADSLLVFGMVTLMPGLGFIISAIITWRISLRLGLMPQPGADPSGRP